MGSCFLHIQEVATLRASVWADKILPYLVAWAESVPHAPLLWAIGIPFVPCVYGLFALAVWLNWTLPFPFAQDLSERGVSHDCTMVQAEETRLECPLSAQGSSAN